MAYTIMGGLAIATVLTLVFLPALYVAWFRIRRPPNDPQMPNAEQTEGREAVRDQREQELVLETTC
jgi:hypothetical protein